MVFFGTGNAWHPRRPHRCRAGDGRWCAIGGRAKGRRRRREGPAGGRRARRVIERARIGAQRAFEFPRAGIARGTSRGPRAHVDGCMGICRGYLHCGGMAGVDGRSCDVGCFTRFPSDSGGDRSRSDQLCCWRHAIARLHEPQPRPAFLRNPTASGGEIPRQATRAMMRLPTPTAIYAAELRVAQSRWNTRDSLRRARVALLATLARPSTLALVAGAAGLFGFWLARRPRSPAPSSSEGVPVGKTTSAAGLVLAFLVRYAVQRIPTILQHVWAAGQKPAARVGPDMSKWSATDHSAAGVRR